jgi:pyruvate/2-oxoglutarate dehydrogenase complex dihydrolipoamide acyltransferase (E2) component
VDTNVFETANAGFAQAIYEEYLRNPAAVAPEWRRLFESGVIGEVPTNGKAADRPITAVPAAAPAPVLQPSAGALPLKGPAARLVANMNESLTVPTATTFRELPVAALESRRRDLNTALQSAGRTEKISFTHLIGYAIVRAVKARNHGAAPGDARRARRIGSRPSMWASASPWTWSGRTARAGSWFRSSRRRNRWTSRAFTRSTKLSSRRPAPAS